MMLMDWLNSYWMEKIKVMEDDIILGRVYDLDLGSQAPISVRPTKFIDENRVLCEYLNSYAGRVEVLDVNIFPKN